MKLNLDLEIIDMGDEVIAVPVGESSEKWRGIIRLNNTGKELLDFLKNDVTEQEIINSLAEKYENSVVEIKEYVHRFIMKLNEMKMLD